MRNQGQNEENENKTLASKLAAKTLEFFLYYKRRSYNCLGLP